MHLWLGRNPTTPSLRLLLVDEKLAIEHGPLVARHNLSIQFQLRTAYTVQAQGSCHRRDSDGSQRLKPACRGASTNLQSPAFSAAMRTLDTSSPVTGLLISLYLAGVDQGGTPPGPVTLALSGDSAPDGPLADLGGFPT